MSDESLARMLVALSSEIKAIRAKKGSAQLTLTDGVLTGRQGDLYLYAFPFLEERSLRDDSPVEVIIWDAGFEGTLVSCAEGQILVGLTEDLGERVERAVLVIDDAFLIERLQDALSDVAPGQG